jgi:hypothetical protein
MRSPFIVVFPLSLAAALITAGLAGAQEHEHGEQARAHSHSGFPEYVDIYFTHHAYLERKIHPRFDAVVAAHGNQYSESVEFVWQFNPWLGIEVQAGAIQTDPELGDGAAGLGDTEIAPMVAFHQDPARLLIVAARSGFVLPTGDEDEGLGVDGWGWEPGLLLWKGFGSERRGALQAELGYDRTFADEGEDEEELVYNLGLSWWTRSNFIPVFELNGITRLRDEAVHEDEEGEHEEEHAAEEDTLLSGTVGFRYAFANAQQWGAGIQVPLSGTDAYDWRLVVGGIIHLR